MARYHVAGVTTATAAGAVLLDIRTTSTDRARLLELGLFLNAATASLLTLERSTAVGTTSTTVTPQAGDPAEGAPTVVAGTAWSAQPTASNLPLRRIQLPATLAAGVIWTFGFGDMTIPVSSSLVVVNRGGAASSVVNWYAVIDE